MLTPSDHDLLESWKNALQKDIQIGLALPDDPQSPKFQQFCDALVRHVPDIRIKKEDADEVSAPTLSIGKRIRYQALPLEKEFEPFLSALADPADAPPFLMHALGRQLDRVDIPVFLKVFITPHCPHCPQTVRRLLSLAKYCEAVRLTVIDALLFPEQARPYDIRSTPTVLMDDRFRWTGSINLDEVCDMIINRDPSKLSALSLKGMFDDGNAAEVARMMIATGKIFPAFIEVLAHEKWPVRLGAMVAFEILVEADEALAAQVIDPLWKVFPIADDRVKGDILYVLGESGQRALGPRLEKILKGAFSEEVIDAAKEALEKLNSV